jgi:protoporphyrinogen oxidase
MGREKHKPHAVVIGAGFTGLCAAYEMTRCGIAVTVLEKKDRIAGLAESFETDGQRLEKFYHHWFNSDQHIIQLAKELGAEDQLLYHLTSTAMYYDSNIYKLSTPLDVLKFKPLNLIDRIRLGLLVIKARRIKDYKQLESITAEQWLIENCGKQVYKIVWQPLLRGKFGTYASQISAVWIWNKLVLRGGSRDKNEKEQLLYYKGSFAAFAQKISEHILSSGGSIQAGTCVEGLIVENGCIKGVKTSDGQIDADAVAATAALPLVADMLEPHVSVEYIDTLRRIKYLANVCMVLELSHSLSDVYWLNVNDADFPFVALIEHTNFQSTQDYGNKNVVYLSKYLDETAELYNMNKEQLLESFVPYIKRIFPKFDRSWVDRYHVYKARHSQPVVECNYSRFIPSKQTPVKGFYIETMAQIYPEDRGTNYAVRQGRSVGKEIAKQLLDVVKSD